MLRLICDFVVRIWHKQVFSWRGSNDRKFKNGSLSYLYHGPVWILTYFWDSTSLRRHLIWWRVFCYFQDFWKIHKLVSQCRQYRNAKRMQCKDFARRIKILAVHGLSAECWFQQNEEKADFNLEYFECFTMTSWINLSSCHVLVRVESLMLYKNVIYSFDIRCSVLTENEVSTTTGMYLSEETLFHCCWYLCKIGKNTSNMQDRFRKFRYDALSSSMTIYSSVSPICFMFVPERTSAT